MWALRRASIQLKSRGLSSGTTRICCAKPDFASFYLESYNATSNESRGKVLEALVYSVRFCSTSSSSKSNAKVRSFSSHAVAKSSLEQGADALENPFFELDSVREDESISEDESVTDNIRNDLETLDAETGVRAKESPKTNIFSALTKVILVSPTSTMSLALDKWVEAGNEVTRDDIFLSMLYLRKRRMFTKALELLKWPESIKHLGCSDCYYASHVDLIARVHGISKAEDYIQQIPVCYRNEKVYNSLLENYVSTMNYRKVEALFDQMKKLSHLTTFSCDQLLLMYAKTDRKKIIDVLLLMEKENIQPSLFTYQILINVKGKINDIRGMEEILERMEFEGVKPDAKFQANLARIYADVGLKDKAEGVLKDMEGGDITKNLSVCQFLLPIYASLGRDDEVRRIWKVCESNPHEDQCMAAITAWGNLKRVDEAELVFHTMSKILRRLSSRHYAALLKVYADHREADKGEVLMRQMFESGVTVQPEFLDALVKLYVGAGEVEKADAVLEHAHKQRHGGRLHATSYLTILDQYSKRGDVHNAEKIFFKMRQAGYISKLSVYKLLLFAYINAKAPAYGFVERMKGDDFVPNQKLTGLLAQVTAFR